MVIFHSFLYVYQRVTLSSVPLHCFSAGPLHGELLSVPSVKHMHRVK
jgi:hypothetical protein